MKNLITTFLSTLFALLFFISCTQEETILSDTTQETMEPVQLTEQEIIRSNFNLDGLNDSTGIKKDNMKVLWGKHKTITLDGRDWHEFWIEELVKPDLEEGEITDITYSLLATLTDEKPAYWVVKMNSHNGEPQQSYFELEDNVFTGMTYLFDMKGTISMARYYDKGEAFNGISDKDSPLELPAPLAARRCDAKLATRGCTSTSGCPPPTNGNGGCKGGGGHYEWGIVGVEYTDRYMDRNADGRGQESEYSSTSVKDVYGYRWVASNGYYRAPQRSWSYLGIYDNGNSRRIPKPSTQPDRIIIDKALSAFSPCASKLIGIANVADNKMANDMRNAFGRDNSGFDLTYKYKDLPDSNNETTLGQTDVTLKSNGRIQNMTIWLDSDFIKQATTVSIYSVVLHENMHALMYYQLDNKSIAPNNPDIDLSILADKWSKVVAESSGGPLPRNQMAYAQHEIISGLVDTMAGYIRNFTRGSGYQIDTVQATALAWVGLEDSIAWTVMDEDEKETYTNIINYERTGFEILSVGTKCK
ncbi:hypothetical protein [Flagellimonas sp. CMM7]|uniref:hypothetical protein n=1 Tax=Flagellimonas sp. CMM7 TaxID=2654676 RepID=UPI0013D36A2F|nr:hypothetical protein [Flagellimonas sp. CMM7]UII78018.1 hypothetical protein LV704_10075 [Flagellimonas sp. CMM7]